jgi:hypothetical protein
MLGIILAVLCSNWVGEMIHSDGVYETDLDADGSVIFLRPSPPPALFAKDAGMIMSRAVWCAPCGGAAAARARSARLRLWRRPGADVRPRGEQTRAAYQSAGRHRTQVSMAPQLFLLSSLCAWTGSSRMPISVETPGACRCSGARDAALRPPGRGAGASARSRAWRTWRACCGARATTASRSCTAAGRTLSATRESSTRWAAAPAAAGPWRASSCARSCSCCWAARRVLAARVGLDRVGLS